VCDRHLVRHGDRDQPEHDQGQRQRARQLDGASVLGCLGRQSAQRLGPLGALAGGATAAVGGRRNPAGLVLAVPSFAIAAGIVVVDLFVMVTSK
jgi:hypothetical protein